MTTTEPQTDTELGVDELRTKAKTELNSNRDLRRKAADAGHRKRHEEVETASPDTDVDRAVHSINEAVRWEVEKALFDGVKEAVDVIPEDLYGEEYDAVREAVNDVAARMMEDIQVCKGELAEEFAERRAREPDRDPDAEYERRRMQQAEKPMQRR